MVELILDLSLEKGGTRQTTNTVEGEREFHVKECLTNDKES